ncbi:MAG TPA: 3'-5' exonuclease [Saprospiraceae bacterium]|nr:3'-5' exonuclease [Saprospiraceae bacterium]
MPSLQHILFLDVETVSQHREFHEMDEHGKQLWQQKIGFMARRDDHPWSEEDFAQSYKERAAIYAEFGKVIVISAGIITLGEDNTQNLRIKSFYGHNEAEVLEAFNYILQKNFNDQNTHVLCGHNIREFDIPYLCRRLTVHGIELPSLINISGKKPWEIKFIADTLELWKYGDHKNFTSLDLLAYSLGIPSPKDVMDGSMVGNAYWEENRLEEIKQYCEKDVVTVAQVWLRLNNYPVLTEEQIVITN